LIIIFSIFKWLISHLIVVASTNLIDLEKTFYLFNYF